MSALTGGRWCSAPMCLSNSKQYKNLSFFSFPRDEERCMLWIRNCGRNDLLKKPSAYCHNNCKLCSVHFENKMFLNDIKNRLQSHAVPTIFVVATITEKEQQISGKQIASPSPKQSGIEGNITGSPN